MKRAPGLLSIGALVVVVLCFTVPWRPPGTGPTTFWGLHTALQRIWPRSKSGRTSGDYVHWSWVTFGWLFQLVAVTATAVFIDRPRWGRRLALLGVLGCAWQIVALNAARLANLNPVPYVGPPAAALLLALAAEFTKVRAAQAARANGGPA